MMGSTSPSRLIALRRRSTSAVGFSGVISLAMVACGGGGGSPSRSPGTERMAQRLAAIAEATAAEPTEYANSARVLALQSRSVPSDLRSQLLHRAELAEELLRAGRTEEAIAEFEAVRQGVAEARAPVPGEFSEAVDELLAISYLRLDERENCAPDGGGRLCVFPIGRDAIHPEQSGSRAAIAMYESILRGHPAELVSRWLLNIAYMTLGEHPDGVPRQWLIPGSAFESEYDIGRFPDIAPELGLDVVGLAGGSIVEDFDGDGYLDIMASSYGLRDQIRYFRNNGDGSFSDKTLEAGLEGIVSGLQIVHTDYNNDGFPDVLVLRGGWLTEGHPNSLLRNNGDGTFADVTDEAGLSDAYPTQAAAWGDYDNDGWVDLYIGNESIGQRRNPSQLFRNNGDGTFSDVAAEAGVDVVGFVKGVAFGDYDNDGWLDLYVSRLAEPNDLFHNNGPQGAGRPTFTEVGDEAGVREPNHSFPTWFFDYNNDGWLDLFVSGYYATSADIAAEYLGREHNAELPRLYRNNGDGTFTDVTAPSRLDKIMLTMGSNFGDLDNDGFLDFYVATGEPSFRALMPNRMFRNAGGEYFQEVTASGGFGHLQKGHGVAFGDLDNDGDQDIYLVLGGAYEGDVSHNALLANPGHGNRWITLKLEGVRSNRAAIGARIRVTVDTPRGERDIYSTVSTGSSFGASSLQQEIGLGDATAIRSISITWPATGKTDVYQDVALDQILHIREGAAAPTPVRLKTFDLAGAASGAVSRRR